MRRLYGSKLEMHRGELLRYHSMLAICIQSHTSVLDESVAAFDDVRVWHHDEILRNA